MQLESFTSVRDRLQPRPLFILAAVAAVTLSTFLQHRPAHAAATLTVYPNPVILAAGQQAGVATVQWNTDLPGGSIVTVSRDGGADYVFATLGQRTGSATLTDVRLGSSYLVRLYASGARTRVLSSATVTTARATASAVDTGFGDEATPATPPPEQACRSRCITKVEVNPHGTYASMRVEALNAVALQIDVGFGLGSDQRLSRIVSGATRLAHACVWSGDLLNLEPSTDYQFVVSAVDAAGNIRRETGFFRTLRRRIDVDFTRIHVIDDSEGFGRGTGELVFEFFVNDEPSVRLDYSGSDIPATCSGCTIRSLDGRPLARVTVEDAPATLRLLATGLELDSWTVYLNVPGDPPRRVIAPLDGESARGSYTAGISHSGRSEEYVATFEMPAHPREGDLRFTVDGVFYVRYVP